MHELSTHAANHAPPQSFLRKYVFSVDHKVIGKQYYGLGLLAVLIGMVLSWLMRIHLVWPNFAIPGLQWLSSAGAPGGVITPEYYLQLMTMHGTLMVFFVLTNVPFAGFGNYFLPIQIGAEDMAFPRFNMMSFWVTFVGFCVLVAAFFVGDGPPLSGWTAYAPLSAIPGSGPGQATGQTLWAISIATFCIGQLLGSLNFITTTLDLRTKGMTLMRMPLCMGMVHHLVHRTAGVRGSAASMYSADPRSRRWHQLLRSFESGGQRPASESLRRLATTVAAPVLVLRTS